MEQEQVQQEEIEKYYRPSQLRASNPDDDRILALAQTLYGEFAGVSDENLQKEYMQMGGSAVVNTFGQGEWKKNDWDTHLYKRFDAVKYQNQPYKEALKGDFRTEQGKRAWRRAVQTSYGLVRGTIKPKEGQFYWTPKEYKKIAGGPALPNPDKLEKVSTVGQYDVYQYKKSKKKTTGSVTTKKAKEYVKSE